MIWGYHYFWKHPCECWGHLNFPAWWLLQQNLILPPWETWEEKKRKEDEMRPCLLCWLRWFAKHQRCTICGKSLGCVLTWHIGWNLVGTATSWLRVLNDWPQLFLRCWGWVSQRFVKTGEEKWGFIQKRSRGEYWKKGIGENTQKHEDLEPRMHCL